MLTSAVSSRSNVSALSPGGTYVMQGLRQSQALDIYHLILAPTHACNLRCKHCYLPDHAKETLPEKVVFRLVDEWSAITLSERGPYHGIFHIKGGEPFVVPYLNALVQHVIEQQSLRLMFTTNGTFIEPEVLDSLGRWNDELHGHLTVIVSVDGATAETHDRLRGRGQFDVSMVFLEALKRMGIHTFLNCVLHADNLHEVPAYIAMARRLAISQINFLPLVPRGYGSALRCHQAPQLAVHERIQAAYDAGDDATKQLLAGSLSHILDLAQTRNVPAAHECVAAYRGLFYITPEGTAYTCPNLLQEGHALGNVHSESLLGLMAKLPALHGKLRGPDDSDRFLCTGERVLYESQVDRTNLVTLRGMQSALASRMVKERTPADMAYCVSRNF